MKALFKSVNLIGDALYISPALRAWIKLQTPPVDIWMWTLNDHVTPLYEGMVRDLIVGGNTFGVCFDRPNGIKFDFEHTFNVSDVRDSAGKLITQGAFGLSDNPLKRQHIAKSYADLLGVDIGSQRSDLKPTYIPVSEWEWCGNAQAIYTPGCILISMFSASCTSRDPKFHGIPNKMLPWDKWLPILEFLRERFPTTPIRFLGAPTDKIARHLIGGKLADDQIVHDGEEMFGIPLNRLALIMQKARLLVTIDNGMAHLAATQDTPTFEMYPKCLSPAYILPVGNPNLQWVQMDPVTVDPGYLLAHLQHAVKKLNIRG